MERSVLSSRSHSPTRAKRIENDLPLLFNKLCVAIAKPLKIPKFATPMRLIIKTTLVLFCVLFFSQTQAQILELDVVNQDKIQTANTSIEYARAHFSKSNYVYAEAEFFKALEQNNFQLNDYLLFANTLLANKKDNLAKEFYREYLKLSPNTSYTSDVLDSLLNEHTTPPNERLISQNLGLTNPSYFNGSIYSSQEGKLYRNTVNCKEELAPKSLQFVNLEYFTIGSIAYFDDGEKAIVSMSHLKSEYVSLYYLYKKKGKWAKPYQLFSKIRGNFAFPFVDEDNSTLYFSSDQVSSYGGYDIYLSKFDGQRFDTPVNLGPTINSEMNEINPTLIDKTLYLSSNGHLSLGGYDIYRFEEQNDYSSQLINCKLWNTSQNDWTAMAVNKEDVIIYTADLYSSELKVYGNSPSNQHFKGTVLGPDGQPIEDALVLFPDLKRYTTTNGYGQFSMVSEGNDKTSRIEVRVESFERLDTILLSNNAIILSLYSIENQATTKKSPVEIKKYEPTIIRPETNKQLEDYYIVLGSSYDYVDAYNKWTEYTAVFSEAEILNYETGLYRIVVFAGNTEKDALKLAKEAREWKNDIWILRPSNQ